MPAPARSPGWRWFTLRRLAVVLLLLAFALVAPHLFSGTELVRIRHALALGEDFRAWQDWKPPVVPEGYLGESAAPDPYFTAVVQELKLTEKPDDWSRAVAIAQHLLGSAPTLNGGALQASLRGTYDGIVKRGDGYCGDFIRAFNALAVAAGLTVRPWAFSFDGFGGHGHIWVEVWSRQQQRWQLLDVFDNYYFVDQRGRPLSALEFRHALETRAPDLQLRLLHDEARPGFVIEAKAWDYFRRGLREWYMPWGVNPFSYDGAWLVRMFTDRWRVAEGLGAVVAGVQPRIHMLDLPNNSAQRSAMRGLRHRLFAALTLGLLGAGLLLLEWRRSRARRVGASPGGWPRVCLVGPLPPPSGGMAHQCEQLQRLLRAEGVDVQLVRTNAPYQPAWIGRVPVLRAGFRLLPYLWRLWREIGRAQVVHVFANSGWAWHLLAAPALWMARLRGVPALCNYRGGLAEEFLAKTPRHVLTTLRSTRLLVTPSVFLQRVFARRGLTAEVIPNIIDLSRFSPRALPAAVAAPHLIVTRNLEPIYDIATALRAFARVRLQRPDSKLTVAGTGPELDSLQALAAQLKIADAVTFSGRIDNSQIGPLYAQADVMLNPSTADNMPNSILEALASGVLVVSTDAGGIPDLVTHEQTALLVPVGDDAAMAAAALRVLDDRALAAQLHSAGIDSVAGFAWPRVRQLWQSAYARAAWPVEFSSAGPEPELPR